MYNRRELLSSYALIPFLGIDNVLAKKKEIYANDKGYYISHSEEFEADKGSKVRLSKVYINNNGNINYGEFIIVEYREKDSHWYTLNMFVTENTIIKGKSVDTIQ